ncbi:MAG: hypothetical protein HVN34_10900 [Methanobacteriaceae archaeon]|jgi:DNA-binding XRE family transcriptional regulator|nr:hypothetical protein [Methanobacteriaceae archaeon]OPY22427.1 MAG: hypothetical protein A4E26_01324 [Methanobacterium sp. PtaU1.Bin097]
MEDDLRYLLLGYRKYTKTTQRELAKTLDIPLYTYTALEIGSFKQPSEHLLSKIKGLTTEFDQDDLKHIGRGYWIKDEVGPDFKYFLRGLREEKGVDLQELNSMPSEECLRTIGSVDMDEFDVIAIGRTV